MSKKRKLTAKEPTFRDAYAQICHSTIHQYGRHLNGSDIALLITALFTRADPMDYAHIFHSILTTMHSGQIDRLMHLMMLSIEHNQTIEADIM